MFSKTYGMNRAVALALLGAALSAAVVSPALGADVRHSGRVLAIDRAAGTLRLDELTASPGPEPRAVERTLRLSADAVVNRVARTAVDAAGWGNAWGEERTTIDTLKPGDFVTVTTGGRDEAVHALDVVPPEG
jgi:hypothetical protein